MLGPSQNGDGALNLSRTSFCQVITPEGEGVRSLGWSVELKLNKEGSEKVNPPEREAVWRFYILHYESGIEAVGKKDRQWLMRIVILGIVLMSARSQ